MSRITLRIGGADRSPGTDDEEGERFVAMVRSQLARGARGALAVAVRPRRVEWLDLRPVMTAGVPVDGFLAALSRSPSGAHPAPLAVGLAGRFELRRGTARAPVGLAFLEWADDRWWHWQRLLRELQPGEEDDDLESITRAVDGDPMPAGLGRWFVRGRRSRASIRFAEVPPWADGSELVH